MKSDIYPLAIPRSLLKEVRSAAKSTGLSMADVMRQSMKVGLPKVREQLSGRVTNVDPLPERELERLYTDREEDAESIRQFIVAQPKDAE
jgi:hypothetical protein